MSGFTFGIGNDDTKDNLLEDNDFFEEDSIKAGEVPEFNEDTTIINKNTSTLEENGLLEKEQGGLREIRHKPAGSNVNLENLISKIKKHNKVNQSIALEAYDLGFRDELPRIYTYTTQLSDKHLETTLEALERGLAIGVSTEDLDGSVFRNLFGEVYNQVNGLDGTEEEKEVSKENLSPSNESLVMASVGLYGLFLAGSWAYNKGTEIWNQLFGQGPRNPESKEVVKEIQKGLRVVDVKSAPNRRIRLILSDTYDVSKTYVFPFKYIPGLEDGLSPIHNYHEILTRFDAMYKDYITLSHDYRKSIHDYDRYIKNVDTDRDYHEELDDEEDLAHFISEDLERPEFNKDPYALDSHLDYLGKHANIEQKKFKLAWPNEKEVREFKKLRNDLRKKYLGNLKKERNIGYDVTGKGDFVKFIEKYNLAKYGDGDELFGTDWIIGCFSLASMNNLLIQLLEDKHVDELFAKVGIR